MDGKVHFASGSFQDIFGDVLLKALDSLSENGNEILTKKGECRHSSMGSHSASIGDFMKDIVTPTNFCSYDMYDDGNNTIEVVVDVPGVKKEDIKLELTKQSQGYILTLTVNRTQYKSGVKGKFERFVGVKSREINLPGVDVNNIQAKQVDGVLYITIRKEKPESQSFNVPIL